MSSITFIKDESYGVHNGQNVSKYTISNSTGLTLVVIEYGATIISVQAPDRNGVSEEVTLNYSTLEDVATKARYFGCSVGRYANRIKAGKFSIDGNSYELNVNNNGINHLHGGNVGYDKKVWSSRIVRNEEDSGVEFTLLSPDGDENYPGTLEVSITYLVSHNTNSLTFNFAARVLDKPTIVNLTNHSYWNLSGNLRSKILDHTFQMSCSKYVPVSETLIPIGELRSVVDTPFAFIHPKPFSEGVLAISGGGAQGIDHCYVVDAALNSDGAYVYDAAKQKLNKQEYLRHIATLSDPVSGRCMTVYGTQPGVQVYTCNFLSQDPADAPYIQHNAVCLETQHLPDSPNHDHFPSTVLRPTDEPYFHQTVHVFSTL